MRFWTLPYIIAFAMLGAVCALGTYGAWTEGPTIIWKLILGGLFATLTFLCACAIFLIVTDRA